MLVVVLRVGALDGPPPCEPEEGQDERRAEPERAIVARERGDAAGGEDE